MSYIAKRSEGAPGAPLALTFHGTGGTEDQFHGLAEQIMPGAHVVSPRGDVSEMGAARFFRRTGEGVYDMHDLAQRTRAMATFIGEEAKRTQAKRVIGMGYSNGANILAAVALDRPDLVDDMVLMHPLIPWQPAPQPGLAGRRILITAGRRDPICPAPMTDAFARYLEEQGASVELLWHEGGHEIRQEELEGIQQFLAPVAA
ncbi:MAG: alpha/beta hydrolase [Pseudomonadota bacterium]